MLLVVPFLVVWLASLTGSYPFGRSRQTIFLILFIAAGLGITMDWLLRRKAALVVVVGALLVPVWYHSMNYNVAVVIPESRKEVMRGLVSFIREKVPPGSLLLVEGGIDLALIHYLVPHEASPPWDRRMTTLGSYREFGLGHDYAGFQDVLDYLGEYRRLFKPPPGEAVWVIDAGGYCALCSRMSTRTGESWIKGPVQMWDGRGVIFPIDVGMDAIPPGWNEEAR